MTQPALNNDVAGFSAQQFLDSANLGGHCNDAFHQLSKTIEAIIAETKPSTVLELGAGRSPLFLDRARSFKLVANDVAQAELDQLPANVEKALFDISSPEQIPNHLRGSVDLVFSRSVFEHVRSIDDAMRTTHALLKPNGVAFHFFPTLYSSPFLLNKLIPFSVSERLVNVLSRPNYKRFPARYAQATATQARLDRWKKIGFREVAAARFYGHHYYKRIPVLRQLEDALTNAAAQQRWDWYTSFAYIMLVK